MPSAAAAPSVRAAVTVALDQAAVDEPATRFDVVGAQHHGLGRKPVLQHRVDFGFGVGAIPARTAPRPSPGRARTPRGDRRRARPAQDRRAPRGDGARATASSVGFGNVSAAPAPTADAPARTRSSSATASRGSVETIFSERCTLVVAFACAACGRSHPPSADPKKRHSRRSVSAVVARLRTVTRPMSSVKRGPAARGR